jgi:hypothetical protein
VRPMWCEWGLGVENCGISSRLGVISGYPLRFVRGY